MALNTYLALITNFKKTMIKLFQLLLLIILFGINSTSAQTTDGPYIFYYKDSVNVAKIINVIPTDEYNENFQIEVKQIKDISENDVFTFSVMPFSSGKKETFKVTTQDKFIQQQSIYPEPSKLLALSDLEGNFYALKKMLLGAEVINEDYEWIYGDGHIVFIGDIFDRGNNVTQCLWLIYELERQAELQGGKVHMLIGNHENMNLMGKTKYVKDKYTSLSKKLNMPYKELYGRNTELGKWLRTKNTVVKIGNSLYVHAGISTDMVEKKYTLDDINSIAKKYYGNPNRKDITESAMVFDTKRGPLWYRGYFKNDYVTNKMITKITDYYNIENIIVGHTIQKKINTYYKNRIIAIDLKHPKSERDGIIKVLYKENNCFYILDEHNKRKQLF